MRSVKKIHQAEFRPVGDLKTWSPMPTTSIEHLDPFIFLNHHGPQDYPPNNEGLPFGPHPHRGMETVTFILEGDVAHRDSGGHESVIREGGIQWMTAGRGLVHEEVSSSAFMREGGKLEILQLWINLPARLKMTKPRYLGLQKSGIPEFSEDDDKVTVRLITGKWNLQSGPFVTQTEIFLSEIHMKADGKILLSAPATHNIFFYVVRGKVAVDGTFVHKHQLVEFNHDESGIPVKAGEDSIIIFGHAEPFHEPIVARGPFVMNTDEEIEQAYADFRNGKMGEL